MAVERKQQFVINLGDEITSRLKEIALWRKQDWAREETEFQKDVIDKGLSLDDQLAYRQKQLSEERGRRFPNQDYVDRIQGEIGILKKQVRQRNIREKYFQSQSNLINGVSSSQQYLDQLKTLKDLPGVDKTMTNDFDNAILSAESQIRKDPLTVLNNQYNFAVKDQSLPSLEKVKKDYASQKLLAKSEAEKTAYDLKIQAINQQMAGINVENKIHNIVTDSVSKYTTPEEKLNFLKDAEQSSSTDTPVILNGVKYDSERAYWTEAKNKYLAGAGTGLFSNFFKDLDTYAKTTVSNLANSFGKIPVSQLQDIKSSFDSLKAIPDVAQYSNNVDLIKNSVLSTAVANNAKQIENEYNLDQDYGSAVSQLNKLKVATGIDTSDLLTQLQTEEAKARVGNAGQIYEAKQAGESNPTIIKSGKEALQYTPEGLATKMAGGPVPPSEMTSPTPTEPPKTPTGTTTNATTPQTIHIVKPGENLSVIGKQYGVNWNKIYEANKNLIGNNPDLIQPNMKLTIPNQ